MRRLKPIAARMLPASVRRPLGQYHRRWLFPRAMREFDRDPLGALHAGSSILDDLVYAWGNEAFSARSEYLRATLQHVSAGTGAVLECGSGLTTLLMARLLRDSDRQLWTLEHSPDWAGMLRSRCAAMGVMAPHLSVAPLRDYGHFSWYDPPLAGMPATFSLVICDGPPESTPGGRYGLLPVMRERLSPACTILLDDVARPKEREVLERWCAESDLSHEIHGSAKPYAVLTFRGSR